METRSLDPADIGRSYDIASRAFGIMSAAGRPAWEADVRIAIEERRIVAVYDADLLVGSAKIRPFRQSWGGRWLAMAGVAGVVVSPQYRGRGVGTALMRGMIDRGRELGYPVSALYPATVPVYRRQGWEIAGSQHRVTIEARLLRDLRGGPMAVREAGPDDSGQMLELMRHQYAVGRACGPRDRTEAELRRELADDSIFAYVADAGFVVFGWAGSDLVVYQIHASDVDTARALWSVVGSGSTVAKHVHAYLSPDDPVHLMIGETVAPDVRQTRWMLRLLDVPAAISGRGYPAGTILDVPVVIDDPLVPENCVTGRLRVSEGNGELVPGRAEPGSVRLGANGLAALYAGTAVSTLVSAGLVDGGDPAVHAQLDSVFAGRPAFLLDYF